MYYMKSVVLKQWFHEALKDMRNISRGWLEEMCSNIMLKKIHK